MKDMLQPDPRPQWLIDKQAEGTKLGIIAVDGASYPYTIIKVGSIEPDLPYAVGFEHPTELFISANIRPSDRPYILAHEIREKVKFASVPEEERCVTALVEELTEKEQATPRRDYAGYVKRRAEYFNALMRYYEMPTYAASVSPKFREGIALSTSFINHIARSLS